MEECESLVQMGTGKWAKSFIILYIIHTSYQVFCTPFRHVMQIRSINTSKYLMIDDHTSTCTSTVLYLFPHSYISPTFAEHVFTSTWVCSCAGVCHTHDVVDLLKVGYSKSATFSTQP